MWPEFLLHHMFFRKRHWYLICKWTLGLVNALNYHWCAVLKHVVSRDFILKTSLCGTSSVSWRNLWHCFIPDFSMSFYITFKKKALVCGSQEGRSYVDHVGIQIDLWVSGSSGSTGMTHFQLWYSYIFYQFDRYDDENDNKTELPNLNWLHIMTIITFML